MPPRPCASHPIRTGAGRSAFPVDLLPVNPAAPVRASLFMPRLDRKPAAGDIGGQDRAAAAKTETRPSVEHVLALSRKDDATVRSDRFASVDRWLARWLLHVEDAFLARHLAWLATWPGSCSCAALRPTQISVSPGGTWVFLKLCGCFGGQSDRGGSLVLTAMLVR